MVSHGRLTSAQDIQDQCIVRDTFEVPRYTGSEDKVTRKRIRIVCGPRSDDIKAFGLQPIHWKARRSSHKEENLRWYGTDSYDQAVGYLREGWRAGTEKMDKLVKKLTPRLPQGSKIKKVYRPSVGPVGAFNVDPVALKTGSPAPFVGMFNAKVKTQGQKIYKIAYNASASAGVNASILEARGAAVLALVSVLTRLGKTVDLTVFCCIEAGDYTGMTQWHVKPAGANVNMDQLAFALVNPSSLRRIGFTMMEHAPKEWVYSLYGGYGWPRPLKSTFPDVAAQYDLVVDSDVYIKDGKVSVEWTNTDNQVEWVKEQLRAQGFEC